jgi:hypothetical protein
MRNIWNSLPTESDEKISEELHRIKPHISYESARKAIEEVNVIIQDAEKFKESLNQTLPTL